MSNECNAKKNMVSKTQYSSLYNYKVASIGFYSPLSLVLRLKVFFNNEPFSNIILPYDDWCNFIYNKNIPKP